MPAANPNVRRLNDDHPTHGHGRSAMSELRPSSARLLVLVVELLPTIEDDLLADLVEQLAITLVERDERDRAITEVASVAADELHRTHGENCRLRERVIELGEALRRRRAA